MSLSTKLRKARSVGLLAASSIAFKRLLFSKGFIFERLGFQILPVHYYSPVPSTRELRAAQRQWDRESPLSGVDLDEAGQLEMLARLQAWGHECAQLPDYQSVESNNVGEGYGVVDAQLLHLMLRHLKPARIVEVGSGVSTVFSVNALSANTREGSPRPTMACIEPYRYQQLGQLKGECNIEVMPRPVQDVPMAYFQELNAGDVLFIDSSHTVKINSDVAYLVLDVLPILKPGVVVHVHDIPFPYQALSPDHVLRQHMFWTEGMLMQAFLNSNASYRILLCSFYIHHKHPQALRALLPAYGTPGTFPPSSLWLQKVA